MRMHEGECMLIGRHRFERRDTDHGQRGRSSNDPVGRHHHAPPGISENSAFRMHWLFGAVPPHN
jgi:hypothetical protein